MTYSSPGYELAYAYITQPSYHGGMEPYFDFLQLFTALLHNEGGLFTGDRLTELAYHLSDEQRRCLSQLVEAASRLDDAAIVAEISNEQYHTQKARRFGTNNPERMDVPFWIFMVRCGWNTYQARMQYDTAYRQHMEEYRTRREREEAGEEIIEDNENKAEVCFSYGPPVWCFDRFGMSNTKLADGRMLFIAGEHEDFYDPDFCIYNDVIVIDQALQVTIYGYPKEIFPATDFHTATLVGNSVVYIIGSLGYPEERDPTTTPVYRLDTTTMQIEVVETSGKGPGWISSHKAEYFSVQNAIKVNGGKVFTGRGWKGKLNDNQREYWLDLATLTWSRKKPLVPKAITSGGN